MRRNFPMPSFLQWDRQMHHSSSCHRAYRQNLYRGRETLNANPNLSQRFTTARHWPAIAGENNLAPGQPSRSRQFLPFSYWACWLQVRFPAKVPFRGLPLTFYNLQVKQSVLYFVYVSPSVWQVFPPGLDVNFSNGQQIGVHQMRWRLLIRRPSQ